jgi:hypothetical protein
MPALLQGLADRDERVYIAGTADARDQDMHSRIIGGNDGRRDTSNPEAIDSRA